MEDPSSSHLRHSAHIQLANETGSDDTTPRQATQNSDIQQARQPEPTHDAHRSEAGRRSGPSKPDSWISRKLAILVVFALASWSFYVIAGRVCTPMIRGQSTSGLGKSTGIGALVGFIILWLLMVTSYLRIITTGPGLAPKRIPKTPEPGSSGYHLQQFPPPKPSAAPVVEPEEEPQPSELAPIGNLVHDTINSYSVPSEVGTEVPLKGHADQKKAVRDWRTIERPLPPLKPSIRWCQHCEIVKPPRTHHCRHCGICVLQFDHHCLWIGQCVGWANHKFFMTFTFWAALFCIYMMVFLIVTSTKSEGTDGQVIALIVVSTLFGLFTFAMFTSHVWLILTGRTTVESFARRDQHEAESRVLQHEYGYFFHNSERRKVLKKWNSEWGNTRVDARWVFGTKLEQWEQEMGKNPLGWILPIGRPLGDGINFESNPRFGPNGEWFKKKDWPKDLQL